MTLFERSPIIYILVAKPSKGGDAKLESPLFERYISADEVNKPAILLIELLNELK